MHDLCEHFTWLIEHGTLGLENITLRVRRNKQSMIILKLNEIVLVVGDCAPLRKKKEKRMNNVVHVNKVY